MKLFLLISVLLLCALQGLAQANLGKPTMGLLQAGAIPPGTIKVEVSLLALPWKDTSCQQDMKQVSVKIDQVVALGSGLINPVSAGDSLNIRILKGMDFLGDNLDGKGTLLIKEQLCSFEETYYSLIREE